MKKLILMAIFLFPSVLCWADDNQDNEVKLRINPADLAKTLRIFSPHLIGGSTRDIYIVDTLERNLYKKGVIIRLRVKHSLKYDINIKLNDFTSKDIDQSWFSLKRFKCETNWTITRSYSSCALKKK